MKTYSDLSPIQLRKKIQEVDRKIEERSPDLFAEKRLLEMHLKARTTGKSQLFAEFQFPWPAIEMCLDLHGDYKLTVDDIKQILIDGGYVGMNPKNVKGLINDSLNNKMEKGILEFRGHDKIVGRKVKK